MPTKPIRIHAVPPPLPPHLRSVPASKPIIDTEAEDIAAKTIPFVSPATLNTPRAPSPYEQPGALMKPSAMVRVFDEGRALVVKLFERARSMQQLKSAVAIQRAPAPGMFAKLDAARVNKLVVSSYKLIGFAVLAVIALALISYLGANVFYWCSTSWIEPTVIAPTDERVLALSTQLITQSSARDKAAADLADAERVQKMQQEFLDGSKQALADELADRKIELNRLMAINKNFAATRAEVASSGRAFSHLSKRRLAQEYDAHFIDRETAVTGALQLSQLAQGNLNMAEKEVELFKRRAELSRETEALGAIVGQKPAQRHSIEILKMLQDVKLAEVAVAKARDNRGVLQRTLERYDRMVKTISESPFMRAVAGKDNIAFVPYDNLDRVKPGTPLYGCAVGPLFCHRVGSVVALLGGEMLYKHPLHNSQLRGQPVQIQLTNGSDAERKVLFVGGRPILF
ncbi:MAG TPA: hypothetical protein VGL86_17420 [Polyangia bacterium]